jgi:CHASE2 domain-containing sensor protein
LRITTFCFLMELVGIASISIQYLLNGGMIPWVSMGFLLCACIIYTYARLQEVNE